MAKVQGNQKMVNKHFQFCVKSIEHVKIRGATMKLCGRGSNPQTGCTIIFIEYMLCRTNFQTQETNEILRA